jgi:hypothetical protein
MRWTRDRRILASRIRPAWHHRNLKCVADVARRSASPGARPVRMACRGDRAAAAWCESDRPAVQDLGDDPMIELISILCSLVICIGTPIEVNRIRGGWVAKKFDGDRERFLAAYRKQLNMLVSLGVVFGCVNLLLALIEDSPGERVVKFVAAAIWFAAAAISHVSRRGLPASNLNA